MAREKSRRVAVLNTLSRDERRQGREKSTLPKALVAQPPGIGAYNPNCSTEYALIYQTNLE